MKSICGTPSGYQRHRRMGEVPCDECKAASNEYQKEWAARQARQKKHPGERVDVELQSGGTVTLIVDVPSFFDLSPSDFSFVGQIVATLKGYSAEATA